MGVTTADIWHMKDPGAGGWYILETNYDHDKAPLFLDDRRAPANKCMKKMGEKVQVKSGLEVKKLFLCSTQLSTKFQLLINTKIATNKEVS